METKQSKRANSGRKPMYGEPTGVISLRLPISRIPEFKKKALKMIARMRDQQKVA